jgi:hypothetical protein
MGGSTSGKGSTTATSTPNPQAMQSYSALMSRANQLSRTPYNPYTGQLVASLTPQQQTAFSEYGNAYGSAQPYIDQASQYATMGASPIQQSAIQNYLNPYQQDVVGATEAQMNNVDAAQLAQTQGQGMGAGGLFNDRLGVAQGQVVNQQDLANNQTLAGLNVANYNQALNAAQADRSAAAQGAYTFGNLGQENLQSILAGAGANLTAGNAQQQQQQNVLSSNYGQWQQAMAYPYQQIGWAAGIDTGLGSNMGGTSTTTPPPPNPLSQYGGLGLAAAGIGYNMSQGAPAFANRGGRVGFDGGGTVTPYGAGVPYIPNIQITHGSGPPKPPSVSQQQPGQMPKMPGGGGGGAGGAGGGLGGITGTGGMSAADASAAGTASFGDMVAGATAAGDVGDFAALALLANKGGRVDVGRPRGLEWGHVRGYADAGVVDRQPDVDQSDDPPVFGLSQPTGPGEPIVSDEAAPDAPMPRERPSPGMDLGSEPAGFLDGPGGTPDSRVGPEDRAQAGLDDIPRVAPPQQSRGNGLGNALMAAGFSLMANRSPYLGSAIGEAGLAGMGSYANAQQHDEAQQHLATKEKLSQANQDRMLKALEDRAKKDDAAQAEAKRTHLANESRQADAAAERAAERNLSLMKPMVIDKDPYGQPIYGRMDQKGNITNMDGTPYTPKQKAKAEAEANLTGEDYIKTLPENHQAQIRQAGAYAAAVPNANVRSPSGRQLRDEIYQAYPDIDERMYGAENGAVRKFWSGPDADTIKSQNVAIMHLGTLQQAANALKNGDYQKVNALLNWWSKETGKAAPTDFNAIRDIAQDEVMKAVVGTRAGVTEREEAHKRITSDFSQGQMDSVINKYKDLMAGQVIGLRQKFTGTTGMPLEVFDRFLLPETKQELRAHEAAARPSGGGSVNPPSTPQGQEGERRQFKQGWGVFHNGQWQPAPAGP